MRKLWVTSGRWWVGCDRWMQRTKRKTNKTNIIQHKKTVTFWYAKRKEKRLLLLVLMKIRFFIIHPSLCLPKYNTQTHTQMFFLRLSNCISISKVFYLELNKHRKMVLATITDERQRQPKPTAKALLN